MSKKKKHKHKNKKKSKNKYKKIEVKKEKKVPSFEVKEVPLPFIADEYTSIDDNGYELSDSDIVPQRDLSFLTDENGNKDIEALEMDRVKDSSYLSSWADTDDDKVKENEAYE